MKKYMSLGEMLTDYRELNSISQADFAASMNVDIRTINRWEKDETLIKSEKEEELVEETFIPYQVIRNLNAVVAIPTFYDFRIRKYALDKLSNELPDASWIKANLNVPTNRIRPVGLESDFKNILRYAQFQSDPAKRVNESLLREAVKRLPELNIIIFDSAGYYSGHYVVFPLSRQAYEGLKNHDITENQLTIVDLVDYKKMEKPVFHGYYVTADCNENISYLLCEVIKFFRDRNFKDYIYSVITNRYDSFEIHKQIGMKIVWEDSETYREQDGSFPNRFCEGRVDYFLK